MRLITSDECGLLKDVNTNFIALHAASKFATSSEIIPQIAAKLLPDGLSQSRDNAIQKMCWLKDDDEETEESSSSSSSPTSFACSRPGPLVEIWSLSDPATSPTSFPTYSLVNAIDLFLPSSEDEDDLDFDSDDSEPKPLVSGLHCHTNQEGDSYLFVVLDNGMLYKVDYQGLDVPAVLGSSSPSSDSEEEDSPSVQNHVLFTMLNSSAPIVSPPPINTTYKSSAQDGQTSVTCSAFKTLSTGELHLALGGRDREVVMYSVDKGEITWKGKNLPPDPQTLLQRPVWQTSVAFWDDDDHLIAVGTAYKELRVYDTRDRRRPIGCTKKGLLEYRVTAVESFTNHKGIRSVLLGDAAGYLYDISVESMDIAGRFYGPNGSIRQIVVGRDKKHMACVGLDRMLRVYDLKSRKLWKHVYLKQRLTGLLFGENSMEVKAGSEEVEGEEIEDLKIKGGNAILDDVEGDSDAEDEVGEVTFSEDEEEEDEGEDEAEEEEEELGENENEGEEEEGDSDDGSDIDLDMGSSASGSDFDDDKHSDDSADDEGFGSDEEFFNPNRRPEKEIAAAQRGGGKTVAKDKDWENEKRGGADKKEKKGAKKQKR